MPSSSNKGRIGVLLVNLGTPDSPSTPDVRRYLHDRQETYVLDCLERAR